MYLFDLEVQQKNYQEIHNIFLLKLISSVCIPVIIWSTMVILHKLGDIVKHCAILYCLYFIILDFWAGITIIPFMWLAYQSSRFYSAYHKGILWCFKLIFTAKCIYFFALFLLSENNISSFQTMILIFTLDLLIIWKNILFILL